MTGEVAAGVRQFSAVVKRSTDQTITNNTATAISFDTTPVSDTGGFFSSGSPTKLTAPVAGIYLACLTCMPWADNATGVRQALFKYNGTTPYYLLGSVVGQSSGIGYFAQGGGSFTFKMAAGEYVEVWCIQTSGGSLAMSGSNGAPEFSLTLVA